MNPMIEDVWGVWAERPDGLSGWQPCIEGKYTPEGEHEKEFTEFQAIRYVEHCNASSHDKTAVYSARIRKPSLARSIGELVAEMRLSREGAPWERLQRLERAVEYLENSKDSQQDEINQLREQISKT